MQKHKQRQVFRGANVKLGNWRQVTVRITTVSRFCARKTAVAGVEKSESAVFVSHDTHGRVYSHRLSYWLRVRKGGDFFYGKSSNENHTEGL